MRLFVLGVLLASLLRPFTGTAAQDAAAATDVTPAPCLTLSDGSGKRITTGMGGSTIGTSTRRACPAQAPANAAPPQPAALPPPTAQPASAAAAETKATPSVAPKRSPQPSAPFVPLARPEPARHFDTGAVQLDADQDRAPQRTPPLTLHITPARLTATVITGGAMMLLLHSGLWTSLLILGLPLWRHVDLLPIVDGATAADPIGAAGARAAQAEAELAPVLGRTPHHSTHDQATP